MRAAIAFVLLGAAALAACQGAERVNPFPDSGDPCSAGAHIDCARFPQRTCLGDAGGACAVPTFGCADASFFSGVDTSRCAADGGPDS